MVHHEINVQIQTTINYGDNGVWTQRDHIRLLIRKYRTYPTVIGITGPPVQVYDQNRYEYLESVSIKRLWLHKIVL